LVKHRLYELKVHLFFYTKKGTETVIPIVNITEVTIQPPSAWEKSSILINTAQRFGGFMFFSLQSQEEFDTLKKQLLGL